MKFILKLIRWTVLSTVGFCGLLVLVAVASEKKNPNSTTAAPAPTPFPTETAAPTKGIAAGINSTVKAVAAAPEEVEEEKPVFKIAARTLYAAYDANEIAAAKKFDGKQIINTGTVGDIGTDILGAPYVILDDHSAQCMFLRTDKDVLAQLAKGQKVVITGKVSSGGMFWVLVRDCRLQPSSSDQPSSSTKTKIAKKS